MAHEVAERIPPQEIHGIWVYPAVRKEEREWGTAIVARRAEGDRIRVYTARYVQMIRGRERGQGRVAIEEVAECLPPVLVEVLKGVQERMAETEPPVEISPSVWYGGP